MAVKRCPMARSAANVDSVRAAAYRSAMHTFIAAVFVGLLVSACGSSASTPTSGGVKRGTSPSNPYASDLERPIAVSDNQMMLRWVGTRYDEARNGDRRRVRVPLVRLAANNMDDRPEWAIAASPQQGPFHWVAVVGATNGIPVNDWSGWVEGAFTGTEVKYTSRDTGVTMMLPVFEVRSQTARGDERPEVRMVPR